MVWPGASFIKCCAETILNLILRSSLEYAYVWFIEWTYEQKTHYMSLSDVKSMNRKWSWTCLQMIGFSSLPCKRLLMSLTKITSHHPNSLISEEQLTFSKTCSTPTRKSAYVCSDPDVTRSAFPRQRFEKYASLQRFYKYERWRGFKRTHAL